MLRVLSNQIPLKELQAKQRKIFQQGIYRNTLALFSDCSVLSCGEKSAAQSFPVACGCHWTKAVKVVVVGILFFNLQYISMSLHA